MLSYTSAAAGSYHQLRFVVDGKMLTSARMVEAFVSLQLAITKYEAYFVAPVPHIGKSLGFASASFKVKSSISAAW